MEQNPYAAPVADTSPVEEVAPEAPDRDRVARSALIDGVFQAFGWCCLGLIAGAGVGAPDDAEPNALEGVELGLGLLAMLVHGGLLAFTGRSLGGRITGTVIVPLGARLPTLFVASFLRWVWGVVAYLAVLFTALFCIIIVLDILSLKQLEDPIARVCFAVVPLAMPAMAWAFARSRRHAPLLRRLGTEVRLQAP